MNVPPTGTPAVGGNSMQYGIGSSMWINKLKIVGSGQNWAVAPCEPFYLMGTEPPAPDAALTGAKNLIEHYGLANAYQKFCSKPLREGLSAFLPHLSGNVDVPSSTDGSGLMSLIERPPIRGKELRPFASSQLEQAFRLHPGPLPQEYSSLFAAAPVQKQGFRTNMNHPDGPDNLCSNSGSRLPASAAPGLTGPGSFIRRRRRYEVHRGLTTANSASGGAASNATQGLSSFFPAPPSALVPSVSSHNPTPLSSTSLPPSGHGLALATCVGGQFSTNTPSSSTNISEAVHLNAAKAMDLPPGLIPVSSSGYQANSFSSGCDQPPPPPPPLLAPVHPNSTTSLPRMATTPGSFNLSSELNHPQTLPAPPLLHSIHNTSGSSTPNLQSHCYPTPHQLSTHSVMETGNVSKLSSPTLSGSSPLSSESHKVRHLSEEERRKKKRKEKKRRKERD